LLLSSWCSTHFPSSTCYRSLVFTNWISAMIFGWGGGPGIGDFELLCAVGLVAGFLPVYFYSILIYLFLCTLLNNSVGNSDFIVLNDCMVVKWIGKDVKGINCSLIWDIVMAFAKRAGEVYV
jgi:hypothetical protein